MELSQPLHQQITVILKPKKMEKISTVLGFLKKPSQKKLVFILKITISELRNLFN